MLRLASFCLIALAATSCDLQKFTVNTTAPVLLSAQASLEQESDFDTAHDAIAGVLKTVEGFWVVNPDRQDLLQILTEGYCQYGAAFIEDDLDAAVLDHKLAEVTRLSEHATKAYTRCLNYALLELGPRWQKEIGGTTDVTNALIASATHDQRTPLMWAAVAIGSIALHNLTRPEALALPPTVKLMLDKVVELDKAAPPDDELLRAMPHFVLGALYSAQGAATGGSPTDAVKEFQTALDVTHNKMLLAHVFWGRFVGKSTNDRKLFHDQMVLVLTTDPAIWPEQRLANEVARRRARRYLSHEKDLF
jgi:hypothetical protein